MKYVLKNRSRFQAREKSIFTLLVLFIVLSCIMVNFGYGFNCNYLTEKNSKNDSLINLRIEFKEDSGKKRFVTKGQLEACLFQLPEDINKKVVNFLTEVEIDGLFTTQCRFVIHNGKYGICKVFRDNMFQQNRMESYFTEEQEAQGQKVAFVYENHKTDNKTPVMDRLKNEAGYVRLQGEAYRVIGTQTWLLDGVLIPFASLKRETVLNSSGINLSFSEPVTKRQYETIMDIMIKNLGDMAVIPPYETDPAAEAGTYRAILLITGLIALIVAINFAILYQYILIKRERKLGIFMLCGMTRRQAVSVYFAECMLLLIPSYLVGAGIWHWIILPWVAGVYPYLREACTFPAYAGLFGIYLMISMAILAASIIKYVVGRPICALLGGRL